MPDLIYKDECYRIVGACFEAYNELGCGFLEPVFQAETGTQLVLGAESPIWYEWFHAKNSEGSTWRVRLSRPEPIDRADAYDP